jgi:hypothetical protein
MSRFIACIGASAVLAFAGSAAAQSLYAVGSLSPFAPINLYAVDPASGATSVIGSTGLTDVIDLAFDPAANRLVALTVGGDRYAINAATGASTLLFDGVDFIPEGGLAINNAGTRFTTNFDNLFIGAESNAFAPVGPSNLTSFDVSGLAFVGPNLLGLATNGTDADTLVRFDTTTGAGSELFTLTGFASDSLAGLAWDFTSPSVFATDGANLFRIDTATGNTTLLGAHGITGVSGIAYIPAPSALALLGLGAVAARRRRTR